VKINIEIIPHDQHRYPTVGDWWFEEDGTLQVRASEMSDPKYSWCVILHELIEVLLCHLKGISTKEVDDFDKAYEAKRGEDDVSEPGDDLRAPYHEEHVIASIAERAIAFSLGIDWNQYNDEIEALP